MRTVTAIYTSPVKSMAFDTPCSVLVGYSGSAKDRRFHLIDSAGLLLTHRQLANMVLLSAAYDSKTGNLALTFPDDRQLEDTVDVGEAVTTNGWGRTVANGEWNAAISEFCQSEESVGMPPGCILHEHTSPTIGSLDPTPLYCRGALTVFERNVPSSESTGIAEQQNRRY